MARMDRRTRVLVVAIVVSFIAFLDGAVINVALPSLAAELGGGLALQQWAVDAYLLTLGSLILLAGSLSDSFGRLRIIRIGLYGFAATSVLCALAPDGIVLVIARGLQGAAGALLVPSSLALIISTFPHDEQGRAIGRWTAWTTAAFLVGPLFGGVLVDLVSWRLAFWINVVPIAVVLVIMRALGRD
jgi:MFS family permease